MSQRRREKAGRTGRGGKRSLSVEPYLASLVNVQLGNALQQRRLATYQAIVQSCTLPNGPTHIRSRRGERPLRLPLRRDPVTAVSALFPSVGLGESYATRTLRIAEPSPSSRRRVRPFTERSGAIALD